ncbi:MAG: hypothetical protein EOM50_14160 [Erysipelotrichia bacterium]|nr:hypothetical protein [Erysipelotrichia bacterium]NCC55116.1 hypothetical protein [Erysipelotrichia bacterium]
MKTKIDKELLEELKHIFNDNDFFIGVFSFASSQNARKKIIDYIKKKDNVTPEEITLLALELQDTK